MSFAKLVVSDPASTNRPPAGQPVLVVDELVNKMADVLALVGERSRSDDCATLTNAITIAPVNSAAP